MSTKNCSLESAKGNVPPSVVSSRTSEIIQLALYDATGSFFSVFGIVTNIINLIVFMKIGLNKNSMIQFFSLAVANLAFSTLALSASLTNLFGILTTSFTTVDLVALTSHVLSPPREKVYATSVVITILLSVERCISVIFPFKVKTAFTKSHSVKIIACAGFICGALLIPDFLVEHLEWRCDERFQLVRLLPFYAKYAVLYRMLKNIVFACVLPILAGVTTTACAVIMMAWIKSSDALLPSKQSEWVLDNLERISNKPSKNSKPSLKNNHKRLARTVFIVDVTFLVCNIPKLLMLALSFSQLLAGEYAQDDPGKYGNLGSVMISITYVFESVHSAVTFVIYYSSNWRFRSITRHIFQRGSEITSRK